jgi:hypothetical protein
VRLVTTGTGPGTEAQIAATIEKLLEEKSEGSMQQ